MSLVLSISLIVVAFVLGLFNQKLLFVLRKRLLRQRIPVGLSAREQYQRYKAEITSKPLPPPDGISPKTEENWKKLSPLVQRQALAARKQAGLDG